MAVARLQVQLQGKGVLAAVAEHRLLDKLVELHNLEMAVLGQLLLLQELL
jgi:hypothetical protein